MSTDQMCAIDGKFQSFLDDEGVLVSAYGIRALILGNLVGMAPKEPQVVFDNLVEHCTESNMNDDAFEQLGEYFGEIWNSLLASVNSKDLPLLSPYPKSDIITEMLLIHLSTRLEEVSNFFQGLNISEGFIEDDEEHEDAMDKLELFLEEADKLLTECESSDNYDIYHDKTFTILKELDESWHETFDVIFEII